MFALVDCNNFFVSCERVFRPELRNRPVCVLSNNDGCIVALSNEAKAIGLKRGSPLFKVRDIVRTYGVTVFSSNYSLYAGLSARVMRVLSESYPDIEIYSIDEAFVDLEGLPIEELPARMMELKRKIQKWTGIPVSIGIAETKTLAKVAGHYAKHYAGYGGVCMIDTDEKRKKALQRLPVGEVWGVGRRSQPKLDAMHIYTAWDYVQMSENWVRHHFSTIGVRTRNELMGLPCVETSEIETKQSICTSRSFGETVSEKEQLLSSIVYFTTACAQKLRAQHTVANILSIFASTDRFKTELPQYRPFATIKLPVPTADTSELIAYATKLLDGIYRPGFLYKKAGAIVSGIMDDAAVQQNLFDVVENRDKRQNLFRAIDRLNSGGNGGTVHFAAQGTNERWQSRKDHVSPDYLNDINGLLKVK